MSCLHPAIFQRLLSWRRAEPTVAENAEAGVFWDLTPFLKDYPNLNREELKEMWKSPRWMARTSSFLVIILAMAAECSR